MTLTVRYGCEHATSSGSFLNPEAPFVGTGMEHVDARDSGAAVIENMMGLLSM